MATYDYNGLANGDNLPSSHIIDVGTWEIGNERLKPTTQGSKLHIVTDAGSRCQLCRPSCVFKFDNTKLRHLAW